ncbi:MAG: cell division protein ZapE, partial [Azovibrio sp.]
KRKMDVVEVDTGIDYRLRTLEQVGIYHYPADDAAEQKMGEYFQMVAGEIVERNGNISVLDRNIPTLGMGNNIIWFDFVSLCGGPRSQNDYLEIARIYPTVLLSRVPSMSHRQASEARRFTWLVDVFYEYKVKLIITADVEPEKLYTQGALANEFARTVSRLIEMHSKEYLLAPHIGSRIRGECSAS